MKDDIDWTVGPGHILNTVLLIVMVAISAYLTDRQHEAKMDSLEQRIKHLERAVIQHNANHP